MGILGTVKTLLVHATLSAMVLFAAWSSAMAQADAPVALLLEIDVSAEADVDAFTEVVAGARLSLGAQGRVEFLHYATCENVIVEGGELTFSSRRYSVRKGKIMSTMRAECPEEAALNADTQIAGIVLRSGGGKRKTRLATEPSFVLVGAKRGEVSLARLLRGATTLAEVSVTGMKVTWPSIATPLEAGSDYTLELVLANQERLELPVDISRGHPPTVLVRID